MKLPLLGGMIYHQPFRARRAGGSVGDMGQVFIQSRAAGMRLGWSRAELFKEQVNPGSRRAGSPSWGTKRAAVPRQKCLQSLKNTLGELPEEDG